ncbi:MAG: hypothetical protein GY868_17755, partial [Deltaproteobacteria bacterium]|nr:hypothetical protein [Deltaproteobacteria bacterium]
MTNNRPKLTIKQQRVHAFLKHFLKENGYPPTVREISDGLNLAGPNSSKKYLDILVRKGYIRKTAKSSRAIELLTEHPDTNIHMLPVIGTIQAGSPLLAIENISAHVAVD